MKKKTIETNLFVQYERTFPAPDRYENYFMACEAIGYLHAIIKYHVDDPLTKAVDDIWMKLEIDCLRQKALEGLSKDFLNA